MDSSELKRLERRMRFKYEWSRARRAAAGFAPAIVVIVIATLLGNRPTFTLALGAATFVFGSGLLWYGRDLRRAVLPGFIAGVVPLTLALCANHFGHACTGESCLSLCLPACVAGGLVAGLAVAAAGHRGRHGASFWVAASGLALLTGAMGCACVGYSGIAGLAIGLAAGLVPGIVQRLSGGRNA
jgi:hypothetical protein